MAGRAFFRDESGSVTIDWVVLSAGIVILGLIVVMQVMGNSSGYLMAEFESLNQEYEQNSVALTELRGDPPQDAHLDVEGQERSVVPR